MEPSDYQQLLDDVRAALASCPDARFAILGHTPVTYDLIAYFAGAGIISRLAGIYCDPVPSCPVPPPHPGFKAVSALRRDAPEVVIVASDELKEDLLEVAAPHLASNARVLLAGYAHFSFRDAALDAILAEALVPSLANGYPHTLVHLYQCLQNAARLGLCGVVVEFGMFKGGTTMMLSRIVEHLGMNWKVIGFDTFSGFPPRRSALDMYSHQGCVFHDETGVRRHLAGRNVEVVAGDVVATVQRVKDEDIVLAFVDTDNYTSAAAILDVIQERVVPGGAIVFDHFTGRRRFRYTLGERMAAKRLLSDPRYFVLHDTGVFFRQR